MSYNSAMKVVEADLKGMDIIWFTDGLCGLATFQVFVPTLLGKQRYVE